MVNFGYPYNDIVICKDSTDYLLLIQYAITYSGVTSIFMCVRNNCNSSFNIESDLQTHISISYFHYNNDYNVFLFAVSVFTVIRCDMR